MTISQAYSTTSGLRLTFLELRNVTCAADVLQRLAASCPRLEEVRIFGSKGAAVESAGVPWPAECNAIVSSASTAPSAESSAAAAADE